MQLGKRKLMGVALSIRKLHFQNLLDEYREERRDIKAARRSRQRRAHLILLARKHRLCTCLKKLRPQGMTLQAGCDQPPYITYDHRITRGHIQMQTEHCRKIRAEWKLLKQETAKPIAANLKTLLDETELVQEKPLEVRWIVENITLYDVWIGDIEVTLGLDKFSVHAWNISVDTASKRGNQHPHVSSDGQICWNGNDEDARKYHASGDFLALKDTIENLLRTYNPRSPYISLNDWEYGEEGSCDECGDHYPDDDLSYSEHYEVSLCPNCRTWCEQCEDCVPEYHYNSSLDACDRCVENGSDICALCLERFWKDNIKTIQMKIDGKLETVPCCETCKEEYEAEQEDQEDENEKEETEDEPERDDHADGACLLAPGVALPQDAQ